jgi:hypothetical protein
VHREPVRGALEEQARERLLWLVPAYSDGLDDGPEDPDESDEPEDDEDPEDDEELEAESFFLSACLESCLSDPSEADFSISRLRREVP